MRTTAGPRPEQLRFAGFDGPLEITGAASPRQAFTALHAYLTAWADARLCAASRLRSKHARVDERKAAELGATGVPFFVIGGALAISGGQRAEVFLQALRQAWDDDSSVIHPLGRAAR